MGACDKLSRERLANRESPDCFRESDNKNMAGSERLAYSIQEAADLLRVDYFSVYYLIQRDKLKACRALRGKVFVPRSELLKLLKTE